MRTERDVVIVALSERLRKTLAHPVRHTPKNDATAVTAVRTAFLDHVRSVLPKLQRIRFTTVSGDKLDRVDSIHEAEVLFVVFVLRF